MRERINAELLSVKYELNTNFWSVRVTCTFATKNMLLYRMKGQQLKRSYVDNELTEAIRLYSGKCYKIMKKRYKKKTTE